MAEIPAHPVAQGLADLHALLAAGGEPRPFVLALVMPLRDAHHHRDAVALLEQAGWDCYNLAEVERTASFATALENLGTDVLPALLQNPYDVPALRRLEACGKTVHNVRRGSAAGPADLYELAGRFSNSLDRKARQAITKLDSYTVPAWWILGKVHRVEVARNAPVAFTAAVDAFLAAHPPPLPLHTIADLHDVVAVNVLDDAPPQEIRVVAVQALRDASMYHDAVSTKVAAGWICQELAQLEIARRFAGRLANLADSIVPRLIDDPDNLTALRDLRACGQGIWKARRHAHGMLAAVMGRYSNALTRAARQAISTASDYVITYEWIYEMIALVENDRDATLLL